MASPIAVAVDVQFARDMTGLGVYTRRIAKWLLIASPATHWTFLGDTSALTQLRKDLDPTLQRRAHFVNPIGRSLDPTLVHLSEWTGCVSGFLHSHHFDVYFSTAFFLPEVTGREPRLAVMIHDLFPFTRPLDSKGHEEDLRILKQVIRDASKRADLVLCPSSDTATNLARLLSVDSRRIRVVHHGIDEAFAPQPPMKLDEARRRYRLPNSYILHVSGTLTPRKNLDRLLQAYEYLSKTRSSSTPPLVLVSHRFANYPYSGLLPFRIRVLSRVADSDLASVIAGASALVYPSLAEGFGFPVLEGLACGVPVVTSDLPVFHEIADALPTYVNPLDPLSIAEGISEALARVGPNMRIRAGIRHARTFSWRRCASSAVAALSGLQSTA